MHSHLAKMLGQLILESRLKRDIKQRDFADELGVSAQFLGRIEKGGVMIPEEVLAQCITLLKMDKSKIVTIFRLGGEERAKAIFQLNKNVRKSKKSI